MQHGKLSVVQIERQQQPDGYTKVLLVEVALDNEVITISEQPGAPLSAPVREQVERLIKLILEEQQGADK